MEPQRSNDELDRATDDIRRVYGGRRGRPKTSPGRAMFASRLRHYDDLFAACGLRPFGARRILDLGCANGKWLALCCERWGAREDNCYGIDLRSDLIAQWRQENPDSRITLESCPAHETSFKEASFDVVHHSMMLSSIPNQPLRQRVASDMWRLVRPGGFIVSYDFWINPINPNTVGITRRELARLFPAGQRVFGRTITLAPPICKALNRLGPAVVLGLERMKIMNSHDLVAVMKRPDHPGPGGGAS